jgi:hypothetical protein
MNILKIDEVLYSSVKLSKRFKTSYGSYPYDIKPLDLRLLPSGSFYYGSLLLTDKMAYNQSLYNENLLNDISFNLFQYYRLFLSDNGSLDTILTPSFSFGVDGSPVRIPLIKFNKIGLFRDRNQQEKDLGTHPTYGESEVGIFFDGYLLTPLQL